jgi:predicted dehydrogenase
MSPQREIGVAVIGVGWIGQVHCQAYRQIPVMYPDLSAVPRVKMIVDAAEPVARRVAERFDVGVCQTDWQAAIDDPTIEAIDICVMNRLHEPIAAAAAKAGKHIFCEKPLANTVAEATRMVETVDGTDVVNVVGFNYRHLPAMRTARQMIESGALGEIFHFRGIFAVDDRVPPSVPWAWRFSREEAGGGALASLGSHTLDLARFLVGDVESVTAMMKTFIGERPVRGTDTMRPVDVEDMAGMLMRFQGGATGLLESTWLASGNKHHHGWEVNGSKGSLRYNSERMNEIEWYDGTSAGDRRGFRTMLMGPAFPEAGAFLHMTGMGMSYSDGMVIELKDFAAAISGEDIPNATFYDGLQVVRATEAALESSRSGRWVDL